MPTAQAQQSTQPQQTQDSSVSISEKAAAENVVFLYSTLFNNQKTLLPLLQSAHLDAHAIGMLLASIGDLGQSNSSSSSSDPIKS
jgi:hypothetical protein